MWIPIVFAVSYTALHYGFTVNIAEFSKKKLAAYEKW